MAVAGPDYKFLSIDVGHMGSVSDGGVWDASSFGQAWTRGENTKSFGCKFFLFNLTNRKKLVLPLDLVKAYKTHCT